MLKNIIMTDKYYNAYLKNNLSFTNILVIMNLKTARAAFINDNNKQKIK